eukprot:TRINITY_DN281_c0_g1_i1.p1 TRINITY_DN281_c0_g1~~TRINITY_DN281_c0_g1_i1.p1  ORF type:complete len:298 (+),score=55.17 TRINITY_DN281_c0_g1_i1:76-894(+)
MRSASFFILVLSLFLSIQCVYSWGQEGHKIVAKIASDRLSTGTKRYIAQFLSGTPYSTLPQIAPLADDYDHSPSGRWSSPCHYVNLPKTAKHYSNQYCGQCCVVGAIGNYTTRLQKESKSPIKCQFGTGVEPCPLEFLTHYTGDVHQPLHVSYASDAGGNKVKVNFFGKETNLHSVWDTYIIQKWQSDVDSAVTQLEQMIRSSPGNVTNIEKVTSPSDWADESFQIVLNNVYKFTGKTLGQAYYQANLPIIQWRLIAGGLRLAKTLNTIFGN